MKIAQSKWTEAFGWQPEQHPDSQSTPSQLVLHLGAREILGRKKIIDDVRAAHSHAHLIGCSTGEITQTRKADHAAQ